MNIYKKPKIQILKFEVEDILTISSADIDGKDIGFKDSWIKEEEKEVAELLKY